MEDHTVGAALVDLGCCDQVPGDGLTFPVGVGGQVDFPGAGGGFLQLLDDLPLFVGHAVFRREVVFDIDRQARAQQVAHMPDGSLDRVLLAQEALDGARLGRRLHDHQTAMKRGGRVAGRCPGLLPGGLCSLLVARARGDLRLRNVCMSLCPAHAEERRPADRAAPPRAGRAIGGVNRLWIGKLPLSFAFHAIRLQYVSHDLTPVDSVCCH